MNRPKNKINRTPKDTSKPNLGYWLMALSVLFFTAHSLVLKALMSHQNLNPSVPLFFRALIGGMIVFVLFYRTKPKRRPLAIGPIFINSKLIYRGLLGLIGTAAFYYTIPPLGIGKASLILSTYVLFAAIIATVFLKEKLGFGQVIWLMIAFIGIALLLSNRAGVFQMNFGRYEIIGLLGAMMAATVVVLIRDLTNYFSAGTIFLAQCFWIGLPILPFVIPKLSVLSHIDYAGLVAVGVTAAGGQLLMNEGFRLLPVTVGAAMQNIAPLLITIGGIVVFGETLSPFQIVGGLFILMGAYFVSQKS